jgi:hypothetical protein
MEVALGPLCQEAEIKDLVVYTLPRTDGVCKRKVREQSLLTLQRRELSWNH